jgi:hypothetical protein
MDFYSSNDNIINIRKFNDIIWGSDQKTLLVELSEN